MQIGVNWVFFQVSIAVLLDNFLTASNELKTAERVKAIQQNQAQKLVKNPLDPLLLKLAKEYSNDEALSTILLDLFKVMAFSFFFFFPLGKVNAVTVASCWTATALVV